MRDEPTGAPPRNTVPQGRTEKISEVVAREIIQDVVARDLQPGAMLPPENVMLSTYGVGRASLREALRILEVQGLITIKPGRGGGPLVADTSSRDFGNMATLYFQVARATFRDLVQARMLIEPMMAGRAATSCTDVVRVRLQQALDATHAALDAGDDPSYMAATGSFHSLIAAVSGNPIIDLYSHSLQHIYRDRVGGTAFPTQTRKQVARKHEVTANAIFAGDARRAERLMREHMAEYGEHVAERFPGLLDEIVDWR